jgi:hypothetical protein
MKPQIAVQRIMDATALEDNSPRTPIVPGRQLEDLLRVVTVLAAPAVIATLLVMVMLVAETATAGAPHTGLEEELVVEAIAEAAATKTTTSPASRGGYDARRRIEEIRHNKSSTAGDNDGFSAFSSRLRNLLLPEKFKPLGITKYDAK